MVTKESYENLLRHTDYFKEAITEIGKAIVTIKDDVETNQKKDTIQANLDVYIDSISDMLLISYQIVEKLHEDLNAQYQVLIRR